MEPELNKKIQDTVTNYIKQYMESSGFTNRKITDTPTDSLSIINKKYATLNGSVSNRPTSSVATVGQFYFNTTANSPMWYDGSNWRNGIGSVISQG